MHIMSENIRDYSLYPPKKRPVKDVASIPICETNENDQPQDLSMKTQRLLEKSSNISYRFQTFLPPVVQPQKLEHKRFTPYLIQNKNVQPDFQKYSVNHMQINKDNMHQKMLFGAEGLKLISEVASMVQTKPIIEQNTSRDKAYNEIIKPYNYEKLTSKSPSRSVLKERPQWTSFHPYLNQLPIPQNYRSISTRDESKLMPITPLSSIEIPRSRGGSTSPPSEYTENSGSDGSPEQKMNRLMCEECGKSYATVAGIMKHRQFNCPKEMNRSFSCKYCSKIYTSIGALKMHIRTHTLPCKCDICGKAFSRPWLLQGHIRTHTGEKPFECSECQRSFADRSNLRAHLQTHAQIKKYACQTCPKTFSRMSLLVKHQSHGCPGSVLQSVGLVHNTMNNIMAHQSPAYQIPVNC